MAQEAHVGMGIKIEQDTTIQLLNAVRQLEAATKALDVRIAVLEAKVLATKSVTTLPPPPTK